MPIQHGQDLRRYWPAPFGEHAERIVEAMGPWMWVDAVGASWQPPRATLDIRGLARPEGLARDATASQVRAALFDNVQHALDALEGAGYALDRHPGIRVEGELVEVDGRTVPILTRCELDVTARLPVEVPRWLG